MAETAFQEFDTLLVVRTDGIDREIEHLGDLGVRIACLAQMHDLPLLGRKPCNHRVEYLRQILALDLSVERVRSLGDELCQAVTVHQLGIAAAQVIEDVVAGHRVEVVPQAQHDGHVLPPDPEFHEDVLHGILSRGAILQHFQGHGIENPVVLPVDLPESLLAPLFDLSEQLPVLGFLREIFGHSFSKDGIGQKRQQALALHIRTADHLLQR